jgi:maintenance of morphology protein 1
MIIFKFTSRAYTNLPQLSLSFIPAESPTSSTDTTARLPTSLAFSFLPDYRMDLSVRSLVGSRSRLQDVPKIAQLVEARIHAWLDERCVEPRVQQIVLPSLWPRKKNTRGGDEGADDVDDTPSVDGNHDSDRQTERRSSLSAAVDDDSLDARMAAEGAKMRAAESRSEREDRLRSHQQKPEPTLRRRPPMHVKHESTEDLRIPGRFV